MKKFFQSSEIVELGEVFWSEFRSALQALELQESIIIGLSGGSSLDPFYHVIRERLASLDRDMRRKIRFAFLDERIVPVDHEERNERQLREKFLTTLLEKNFIRGNQIFSVDVEHTLITGDYSEKVPHIDIALFGVGPDGHIASLFPHHLLLESRERGYLEITDSPKPPAHRITVSPHMISEMKQVFIVFRKGKEEAYMRFRDEDVSREDCPAKIVKEARNVRVMSDIEN